MIKKQLIHLAALTLILLAGGIHAKANALELAEDYYLLENLNSLEFTADPLILLTGITGYFGKNKKQCLALSAQRYVTCVTNPDAFISTKGSCADMFGAELKFCDLNFTN